MTMLKGTQAQVVGLSASVQLIMVDLVSKASSTCTSQ
jgi:hypothetical protein